VAIEVDHTAAIAVVDTATAAGTLVERAAHSVEREAAIRPCAVRRRPDRGHLTEAAAFATARRDGIHFREAAM